jgi:hypothetical protein
MPGLARTGGLRASRSRRSLRDGTAITGGRQVSTPDEFPSSPGMAGWEHLRQRLNRQAPRLAGA